MFFKTNDSCAVARRRFGLRYNTRRLRDAPSEDCYSIMGAEGSGQHAQQQTTHGRGPVEYRELMTTSNSLRTVFAMNRVSPYLRSGYSRAPKNNCARNILGP